MLLARLSASYLKSPPPAIDLNITMFISNGLIAYDGNINMRWKGRYRQADSYQL